jgi:hypothetical protein
VGVVKRRVLRGLWRRLVGVGSYGLYNAPSGRAVFSPSYSARPSLCLVVSCVKFLAVRPCLPPVGRAHDTNHAT